jgi:RNA polymerase-interacting CarD/CdnL/TRCF family regulator
MHERIKESAGNESSRRPTVSPSDALDYAQGDWVVHRYHGVGQIEGIERKSISSQEKVYFRIKTADKVIWMPFDQMDSEQIRPIMEEERFEEAVDVLEERPRAMAANFNTRKTQIKQATDNNIPKETAYLIRDLRARRRNKKGLSHVGRQALRTLTKRFVHEWAVCKNMTIKQARRKLDRKLSKRRTQIN